MPLITSSNRNTIILQDIINWLSQVKIAGVANQRLALGEIAVIGGEDLDHLTLLELDTISLQMLDTLVLGQLECTINFYTDSAKTNLAFSDNTVDGAASFSIKGNRLYYTPADSLINAANGLSTTLNQSLYYVTCTYTDGTVLNVVYPNALNLMFQSVIVSNKPNPTFAQNENQAIIVPIAEKTERKQVAGDFNYLICTFDIYAQLNVYDFANLSELQRVTAQQQVINTIRNTLYIDRTRNQQCTFHDKDLRGTVVGDMKPIKDSTMLKAVVQVKTATLVYSNGF